MTSRTKNRVHSVRTMKNFACALPMVLVLGLTACGDDDNDGGGTNGSAPAPKIDVAQAKRNIAPFQKAPDAKEFVSDTPLKQRPVGKLIVMPVCGVPICELFKNFTEEAVKTIGAEIKFVPLGNTPESISKGWSQVVQLKPDAVVAVGLPPAAIFKAQLDALEKAEVPVVVHASPDQAGDGYTANLFDPAANTADGALMADYVLANAKGPAKILYLATPDFTFLNFQQKGFQAEIKKLCGSCTVKVIPFKATDIGRVVPGRVVSYLQQKPDTNWIVPSFGDVAVGVPPALKAAGVGQDIKLASLAGTKTNWDFVKTGQQAVDLAYPHAFVSWKTVDLAARALVGQFTPELGEGPLPKQFLTKTELTFDVDTAWPGPEGFRDLYKKVWGVK